MLLFRLLLAIGLIATLVFVARSWLKSLSASQTPDAELGSKELARFEAIAVESDTLREALTLRKKILEASGAERERFATTVDEVVRQLSALAQNEQRIEAALDETEPKRLSRDIEAAEKASRKAGDEDTRRLAQGTLDRLVTLRDGLTKLAKRRDELNTQAEHIVLELRSAHVSILEATSASGLNDERAQEIRNRMRSASEELERQTRAEDELSRLIASAGGKIKQT